MNYLDLFAGCGGFYQGLLQAGLKFDWCGFSEINKYAKKVYRKHFPDSEDLGDVRNIEIVCLLYDETKTEVHTMAGKLKKLTERLRERKGDENHFFRGGEKASDKTQNILEYALKRGLIEKRTNCELCGQEKKFKNGRSGIQAHHPDYNKPLAVMWLCQKCHYQWHKNNKSTLLKGDHENAMSEKEGGDAITEVRSANRTVRFNGRIDLITFGFP